ncbi:uncharacterized protein LOC126779894 isoform X2 [Nymphalis io]|nr:uncharacterized protein LOC126779894 isoform X2 [Nymphalis io]XP_050360011.1 uncharacterized protein LOC126779894 isoform X2 [Nymphalis io]
MTEENDKMALPEIYVECKYLPSIDKRIACTDNGQYFNKVYEIDGIVFKEEPSKDDDALQEFEIHTVEDNVTLKDTGNRPKVLLFSIQETPYGIIINSNILVPENSYHTIISDQEKCLVCDVPVELSGDHLKLDSHKDNLEKYQPLKEYDGVIRKINAKYYCAVCNVIFKKAVIDEHFSSTNHEAKTLFAINRASDVLYSFKNDNLEKSTNYHFDWNKIRDVCDESDETTCAVDECVGTSNVTNDDVVKNVSDNDSDNGSDNVNDRSSRTLSYAAVVKKYDTIKYKDIILDGRKVQVTFDSWHMILTTRKNEFYCMVCVGFHDIGDKADHCSDETHLNKLGNCETVERYTEHVVRKLNDRFYHCGICNQLQLNIDIDNHINIVHSKKNIQKNTNVTMQNTDKESQAVINNASDESTSVTCYEMNRNLNPMQMYENEPMVLSCCYIYVNQFNYTLRVSLIAYNMVCKRPDDYYCFKCNCCLTEFAMSCHIYKQAHIENLAFTPFEPCFGVNLIRLVNQKAHCTLCNILFDSHLINVHINDKLHMFLLNEAIGKPSNVNTAIQPTDMTNRNENIESISTNDSKMELRETNVVEAKDKTNDSKMELRETNVVEAKDKTNDSKMELRETNVVEAKDKTNDSKIECYNSEFVYLKYKNTYAKVTLNAYNSVLSIGDGTSYCFVCSKIVFGLLKDHIENPDHVVSMKKFKFIDKSEKHLLRQNQTTFHCCNCNVIVSKSELSTHMSWQALRETKVDRKIRRNDLKSGIKQIVINLTKESCFDTEQKSNIEVVFRIDIKRNQNIDLKKTNKIIIHKGKAVKVCWDAWHSVHKKKDCYQCLMCQKDVKYYELSSHISNEQHKDAIKNTFQKNYLPNLLRKVDEQILNCLTCNMLVSSKDHIISKHISGKKHISTKNSLQIDCDNVPESKEDIFNL